MKKVTTRGFASHYRPKLLAENGAAEGLWDEYKRRRKVAAKALRVTASSLNKAICEQFFDNEGELLAETLPEVDFLADAREAREVRRSSKTRPEELEDWVWWVCDNVGKAAGMSPGEAPSGAAWEMLKSASDDWNKFASTWLSKMRPKEKKDAEKRSRLIADGDFKNTIDKLRASLGSQG